METIFRVAFGIRPSGKIDWVIDWLTDFRTWTEGLHFAYSFYSKKVG